MLSGSKACKFCRSRQELSNESLPTKISVDSAENEPSEILKFGCRPTTDKGPCRGELVEPVELFEMVLLLLKSVVTQIKRVLKRADVSI